MGKKAKEPRYLNTDPKMLARLKRFFLIDIAGKIILGIIIVAFIAIPVSWMVIHHEPPEYSYLVSTHYSDGTITIQNNNKFKWKEVSLRLETRTKIFSNAYYYETKSISPGHELKVNLNEFKDDDNIYFDTSKETPWKLFLWADGMWGSKYIYLWY
jgi:hypothetical protein